MSEWRPCSRKMLCGKAADAAADAPQRVPHGHEPLLYNHSVMHKISTGMLQTRTAGSTESHGTRLATACVHTGLPYDSLLLSDVHQALSPVHYPPRSKRSPLILILTALRTGTCLGSQAHRPLRSPLAQALATCGKAASLVSRVPDEQLGAEQRGHGGPGYCNTAGCRRRRCQYNS